jgi:hypothetical protein
MRAKLVILAASAVFAVSAATDRASADPITLNETYSTTGTIYTPGVTGTPVVSFQGVENGSMTTGSPFNLGQFVVQMPSSGSATTYVNTPFTVSLDVKSVNGAPSPQDAGFKMSGNLSGTVSGSGQSTLTATFFPPYALFPEREFNPPFAGWPSFQTGQWMNHIIPPGDNLPWSDPQLWSVSLPATSGGATPVMALDTLTPTPVPEPSAWITFGMVGMAILCRYGRRNGTVAPSPSEP